VSLLNTYLTLITAINGRQGKATYKKYSTRKLRTGIIIHKASFYHPCSRPRQF
jgi:hypothetical protein